MTRRSSIDRIGSGPDVVSGRIICALTKGIVPDSGDITITAPGVWTGIAQPATATYQPPRLVPVPQTPNDLHEFTQTRRLRAGSGKRSLRRRDHTTMTRLSRLGTLAAISLAATTAALSLTTPAHADSADVTCQSGTLNGSTLNATGCQHYTGTNLMTLKVTFEIKLPDGEFECSAGVMVAGQLEATGCA